MVILLDENMNYLLSFISVVVLEEEIKYINILYLGCFKFLGIRVNFMIVLDKNKCIKIFLVLY